jgi:glucokinase
MPDDTRPLAGAIDLGGTKILSVVVNDQGEVLGQDVRPTEPEGGPDAVMGRMRDSLVTALAGAGPGFRLSTAGVAAPGPIDFDAGVVVEAPNLHGWQDVPVSRRLGELLGVPIVIENDANAAAWGEFVLGAGRGVRHMIYLTISTGVGGGLVLDGRLYRGADGAAGELGHVPLVEDGPPCGCGAHGCLEVLASGTAIAREATDVLAAGRAAGLRRLVPAGGEVTAADVHRAAQEGDADARAIIEQAGRHLGAGLTAFVNIFNPDLIVIGGGAAKIGAMLLDPAVAVMQRRAMRLARERVRIVPAALGDLAGALGAAALARDAATA